MVVDGKSMRQITCHDVTTALHKRADGRPPGGEAASVDEHLGTCASCRSKAESLDWAAAALRQAPRDLPPGFADRILQRVAREGATRSVQPRPAPVRFSWALLPAAAL